MSLPWQAATLLPFTLGHKKKPITVTAKEKQLPSPHKKNDEHPNLSEFFCSFLICKGLQAKIE
jgi:hypothetical protein